MDFVAYSATLKACNYDGRRETSHAIFENREKCPCVSFSCFWENVYGSTPVPQTPSLPFPCPGKFLVAPLQSGIILAKHFILNTSQSLTTFWIRLRLGNCSVIYTVALWYILHQTHSEFWHIQHFSFSGVYRHIQSYSDLSRHIQHPM